MVPLFLDNIQLALPEVILLLTACLALIADLFFQKCCKDIALTISLIGLALATLIAFLLLGNAKTIILGGLYISDDVGLLMKVFIGISAFLCFFYSKTYIDERHIPAGDYYLLGLFSTIGMMILVSAHSLLTVYLGLELLSLPLYAMTAICRTKSDPAEAALKYFVMGAIASGMILYGFSLLYGVTGKLDLMDIANAIAVNWQDKTLLLSFALVFIMAGVGFKLAAFPFHMWAPDVYQGAPTSVSLFLSTAPKVAAMGMAFRILLISLDGLSGQWQQLILIMSLLSAGVGNLLAVNQTNIKRLFAYSAIAHIGYALFGLLAATPAGYSAALYYILIYSIMTTAAFGLLVMLSYNGVEVEQIDDLKGLNKRNPWLAFLMLIVLFSMAGVPPTVGFFIKLAVLKALVDVHMVWVAVLGVLFAVIGVYYYIKLVKVMYFDDPVLDNQVILPKRNTLLYSANCLALLYLGIFPATLFNACLNAFQAN